jgi:hypothetical protein
VERERAAVVRVEKYPKINLKIKTYRHTHTHTHQKGNQKKRKWDILGH